MEANNPQKKYLFIGIIDAVIFVISFYFTIDAAALHQINKYSHLYLITVFFTASIISVIFYFWSYRKRIQKFSLISGPLAFIFCSVIIALLMYLSQQMDTNAAKTTNEYFTLGWFPSEWHILPTVWFWFFVSNYQYSVVYFLLSIGAIIRQIKGKQTFNTLWFSITLLVWSFLYTIINIPYALKILGMMSPPLIASMIFGLLKQKIAERRAFFLGIIFMFPCLNYLGIIPFSFLHSYKQFPGLTKIFPVNTHPQIPPIHYRDLLFDEKKEILYISWGPTCGLLKIDLKSGKQENKGDDLMRYIEFSSDHSTIIGAGWYSRSYIEYSTNPFKVSKKISLSSFGVRQLFTAKKQGSSVYFSASEHPIIARINYDSWKPIVIKYLTKEGLTKMPIGPAHFLISPDNSKIYLTMMIADVPDTYVFYILNAKTLDVIAKIDLPELIVGVAIDKHHDYIYLPSFFTRKIFYIDLKQNKITDIKEGVFHSRMLYYDPIRDFIIAGSFYNGELAVIDRKTGKKMFSDKITHRIQLGKISEDGNRFVFNTSSGVYTLDLIKINNYIIENNLRN
ncbi:MAG: hypothetical protein HQK53_00250 [Oligoflexia bacterium]|nr:hypothetical protein [Oligoflexia bacterium]